MASRCKNCAKIVPPNDFAEYVCDLCVRSVSAARIATLEAELVGLKELLKRMRCHIYAEAHYGNSVNAESWLGYLSDIDAAIKTQEPPNAK